MGNLKLKREHRCGEGFSAQNSATMIVGIGNHDTARSLTVRWPAGKSRMIKDVPHGTLLTTYEDADESADGSGFDSAPYRNSARAAVQPLATGGEAPLGSRLSLLPGADASADAETETSLQLYTTMATWCAACKRHLPQIATLRSAFTDGELKIYGVPIDAEDTPTKLKSYESTFKPAYRLLVHLTPQQRSEVQKLLLDDLGSETLPSTIVTDMTGRVLQSLRGVPTVSDVRKWMGRQL